MEENINTLFWNGTIEEIKKGYIEQEDCYRCIICGEVFIKGQIYKVDENLYDTQKATQLHIEQKHHSMLNYIINMNNSFIGITEIQKSLLQLLAEGNGDKEVGEKMKINPSTVRNHKYRLREKEKQAKIFLVLMQLLEEEQSRPIHLLEQTKLCETPKTATMIDDRYNTTEQEKEKIIAAYFDETGKLKNYPAKEKRKIIVLEKISTHFKKGKFYSETEINRILTRICDDHATLRRAMIEYGFMERANDGDNYWIKE